MTKCQYCTNEKCPGVPACKCARCKNDKKMMASNNSSDFVKTTNMGIDNKAVGHKDILTEYGLKLTRGSDGLPYPVHFEPTGPLKAHWESMLNAGLKSQQTLPNAIPTGGTIAAFYANHRLSYDLDHLLMRLREEFETIGETLNDIPGWTLAKKTPGKIILGSIGDVEVGFRQIKRRKPLKTVSVKVPNGEWVIPTFGEILNIKASMIAVRGAVRDYLDFVALANAAGDDAAVLKNLNLIDNDFEGLQEHSILLTLMQNLSDPNPEDLDDVDLTKYKGLKKEFQDWDKIKKECHKYARILSAEHFKKKDYK